jgi:hypothetical protein
MVAIDPFFDGIFAVRRNPVMDLWPSLCGRSISHVVSVDPLERDGGRKPGDGSGGRHLGRSVKGSRIFFSMGKAMFPTFAVW